MLKYIVWYYYFKILILYCLLKRQKMTYEVTQHVTTYPGLGQVVAPLGVDCNTLVMIPITSHLV